ncbi:MAG TPA: hypothetical protein VK994_06740 [Bacteroidales bacterium]|nr:hypothetical protein [Bacteroidales bacterium]
MAKTITFARKLRIFMVKALKYFWKVIRALLKAVMYFLIALIFVYTIEYLTAPYYTFPAPKPFSGDKLFNPYQGIDSNYWRKGNFQIQSEAWFGITDGRKNTNEGIDSIYSLLDYDIIAISDYQKINRYGEERDEYIPVYEHGYGIFKNHHVMIGAHKVVWRDYPIFQNIHHKQHMLNVLRSTSELVFIAHPKYAGGWVPGDMTWITNYDGIEVLNGFRVSLEHWDAALSAGKNMRILADDDAHDITNINEVGNYATLIYSPVLQGDSIVSAMKAGRAFGAFIFRNWGEPMDEKIEKALNLPKLSKVELNGDTLTVAVNQEAAKFRFVGQDGQPLDSLMRTAEASYIVRSEDTYVRTEIHFPNRTAYYLNPVIRYDGGDPWAHEHARIDHTRTWLLRIIGFATLIFIVLNIYYLRKRICKRASH